MYIFVKFTCIQKKNSDKTLLKIFHIFKNLGNLDKDIEYYK